MLPIEVSDNSTLQCIYKLRAEMWISQGIPQSQFPSGFATDNHDEHSIHWVIKDNNIIVASARMCVHQILSEVPRNHFYEGFGFVPVAPIASFNWLIVHPLYRKLGLSHNLDDIRLKKAAELGCQTIVIHCSQLSGEARRISLLKKGFRLISPINYFVDWCDPDTITSLALILNKV